MVQKPKCLRLAETSDIQRKQMYKKENYKFEDSEYHNCTFLRLQRCFHKYHTLSLLTGM